MAIILGLDVGIASVGFALIDEKSQSILANGVHLFDAAEQPKTGASLAAPRRLARGQRRRLRRRRQRLDAISRLLKANGLIDAPHLKRDLLTRTPGKTPWQLRAEALTRRLSDQELARVLLHIAKHRGFQSNRKDKTQPDDDNKKLLAGANQLRESLEMSGAETIGAYLATLEKQRNQPGQYERTVLRNLLREETALIFQRQAKLGNEKATFNLCHEYSELAFSQLPLKSSLGLVGKCYLEPEELRAPKNAYSAELFVMHSRLLNLRIVSMGGSSRDLSEEERRRLIDLAHKQKTGVTFARTRKMLDLGDEQTFNLARYRRTSHEDQTWEHIRDRSEKATLIKLEGFHKIRALLEPHSQELWDDLRAQPEHLDQIARAFTFFNDEQDILRELAGVSLNGEAQNLLLTGLDFKGTVNLSLKAIYKLLPHMERGIGYDAACLAAGYHHHSAFAPGKHDKLPPVPETRNPVADRALAQTRKVINAVIRRHGMPDKFHIELARDLGQPGEERRRRERENEKFRRQRESEREHAEELFGRLPSGEEFLKYRLWKEQKGFCIYSGSHITPNMLRDPLATQIDHALPRSRSWDNSYSNKVLCLSDENQKKGDRTPYEYLSPLGKWEAFQARAKELRFNKRRKISLKNLDEKVAEEFKERNLNDTRYIARAIKNHLERRLKPNDGSGQFVFTRNGAITSMLRGVWGLGKKLRDDDRHHAMDAIIVACTTQGIVQKATNWNRYQRNGASRSALEFPKPWPEFRGDALGAVESVFVSRQPVRKVTGQLHEDTIKSGRRGPDGQLRFVQRVGLQNLKPGMLERLVDIDFNEKGRVVGRNRVLFETLRKKLDQHGDSPQKAFAEPIFMPANKPGAQGPLIRSVRVWSKDINLVPVPGRQGYAKAGSMVRVDIFAKDGKFYLCPVYTHQMRQGELPDRICTSGKPMEQWDRLDNSYQFKFSLFKNDYLIIENRDGSTNQGYYVKTNISDGGLTLRHHCNDSPPKKYGVKTAKNLHKFTVNYFGELNEVRREKRLGVADSAGTE